MSNTATKEAAFETVIDTHLVDHGYVSVPSPAFDCELAIFPEVVLGFIRETQPKEWSRLHKLHGERTGDQIIADLCKWMDSHGSLATLRHGFKCYGRTLRVAFFKPAHGMNPDLAAKYAANRVGVTRQLYYKSDSKKSIDVVLSVNGIPLVTIELKNPMTGQTVDNAKRQYQNDRDPNDPIFLFKRRTLVHFAADPDLVFMTTRLAGTATYFLPFNRGNKGGAGNPADPAGRSYKTAYLWEQVFERDSFLDLLARFLHLQIEDKRTEDGTKVRRETMIFPRYHQLDAVRKLVAATEKKGPGTNYLVEHSAGSGKSNTIAWLAHRLSSLHNTKDERIFDSVIVVTDRVVLDQQLQDTVYQFEHRMGVVQKIDDDSRQLAEALENSVPLIITTLQKFPFVSRQLLKMAEERGEEASGLLPTRKCAVVIDEAHSSQSGETSTELKAVLGGEDLADRAKKAAEEDGESKLEELYRSMAKRSRQANLSFFAFTATPKHKTLKVFGSDREPHRYTMRQAIEEGFILDVLRNYVTYATYFHLLRASDDDPNVERKKAARALARYLKLHPHNVAQKTQIMVEHFHAVTRHKIGGRAKAMVVTGSRLEAVRYKQAFDKYIRERKYPIKTLVAFSGTVTDDKLKDVSYTEVEMNDGVKEKELPEAFGTPDYQVLLVAEKYQTGFDQPLLHTMFIDKRLSGIQAVQTLSRLNRTHPLKEDTFVLDFVKDNRDEVQTAFKTYFDGAELGEDVDPAKMYEVKAELDASGVYLAEEVERFAAIYYKPRRKQSPADHQAMNATLDPAVSRFKVKQSDDNDEAELWRGKLAAYRNLYAFLSQVIPYQDSDLEKLYTYLRHLAPKLPKRQTGPTYEFDDEVRLDYYRLQKISEGSISLADAELRQLDGPVEVGTGIVREEEVPLSRLIDVVNDRFGTDFTDADQLFFDQLVEEAMRDEGLKRAAEVNPADKFELVFKNLLEALFIERIDQNQDIFARFMNDDLFQKLITAGLSEETYRRLRGMPNTDTPKK
ncbi:type I restriction endonuclease subunit R [Adhaeretor mobilis]|uniref:Type-1 restriction enzyme R protein n=1 Tax=Adhaeretor mobilis TaxID=1930276 RepID=A0A517MWR1_9BACT|nr:type I restriction endonuclease [Adhaeretor mobilis]QDS99313.1 Type-1 restriction enzyme R protein [Adhaeretor mobilis]